MSLLLLFAGSGSNIIATHNFSLHPVNCIMEGNAPISGSYRTAENLGGKRGSKVTITTRGARRLGGSAPSFTTTTKKGGFID